MPAPIVIYGPTASGKTSLSLRLAKLFDGEIVNTDSRQIYRGLDIGTGKITATEMEGIPHHLLNIIDPDVKWSVGMYFTDAERVIADIIARGKTPILCGGTGLYIDAVVFESFAPAVPPDWEYRHELEAIATRDGNLVIWEMLAAADPEYAKEIHPNSLPYVIRGLEVLRATGISKMARREERRLRYRWTRFVTPYDDTHRVALYDTINTRIEAMWQSWLVQETSAVLEKFGPNTPALKTIGYEETAAFLHGEIDESTCKNLIAQHNRNYAKRQITWNKRYTEFPHLNIATLPTL